MKKALINPLENNRIVQVENKTFEVAEPLFWIDCNDDVTTNNFYDGAKINAPKQQSQAEIDAIAAAAAKAELLAIDVASVRALREYIASKADAPQILKDKEAAAIAARAKLK